MSPLSPFSAKLYIFNICKLSLCADPPPAPWWFFVTCLWTPSSLPISLWQQGTLNGMSHARCARYSVAIIMGGIKKKQNCWKWICLLVSSLRVSLEDGISGLALDVEMSACVSLRSSSLLSSVREMEGDREALAPQRLCLHSTFSFKLPTVAPTSAAQPLGSDDGRSGVDKKITFSPGHNLCTHSRPCQCNSGKCKG